MTGQDRTGRGGQCCHRRSGASRGRPNALSGIVGAALVRANMREPDDALPICTASRAVPQPDTRHSDHHALADGHHINPSPPSRLPRVSARYGA